MSTSTDASNPATRSHTALFILLGKILRNPSREPEGKSDRIVYQVNRPGQNAVECYTLATLTFILTSGPPTVLIGRSLGGRLWSFVLAFLLAALLAFVAYHILFFGFAFIYRALLRLRLLPSRAPRKMPESVYLNFFTLLALAVLFTGDPLLIACVIPWLAWFIVNLFAGIILFAGKLGAVGIGYRE